MSDRGMRAAERNDDVSLMCGVGFTRAANQQDWVAGCAWIQARISADFPCASSPSTSANFRTVASDFFSPARLYSTTLVRRWNWSTVKPANDAPAPPVGNSWLGPAT